MSLHVNILKSHVRTYFIPTEAWLLESMAKNATSNNLFRILKDSSSDFWMYVPEDAVNIIVEWGFLQAQELGDPVQFYPNVIKRSIWDLFSQRLILDKWLVSDSPGDNNGNMILGIFMECVEDAINTSFQISRNSVNVVRHNEIIEDDDVMPNYDTSKYDTSKYDTSNYDNIPSNSQNLPDKTPSDRVGLYVRLRKTGKGDIKSKSSGKVDNISDDDTSDDSHEESD